MTGAAPTLRQGGCFCGAVRYEAGGTPLTFEAERCPDEIDVTIVSLDEAGALPPRDHAYAASRLSWDHLDPSIPVRDEAG